MLTKSLIIRMLLKFSRDIIVPFLIIFSFLSCEKEEEDQPFLHPKVELDEASKNYIVRSYSHLAFPDLIKYQGKWYLTYREGDGHVYKTYSKIIVMSSYDFVNWERIQEFEIENWDLRDSKFSYNSSTNKLYLHYYGRNTLSATLDNKQFYREFDNIENNFTEEKEFLRDLGKWKIDWHWRPHWYKGIIYSHGYYYTGIRTYKSSNLESYPKMVSEYNVTGWSEATSSFKNDSVFTVIRTLDNTKFGYADINNFKYTFTDIPIKRFGGPSILSFKNDKFILAGRNGSNFNVYIYDFKTNKLELILSKATMNEDNAYNGLVLEGNLLYVVFYHQIRSGEFVIDKVVLNLSNYD